jgi:hypothetical protein
MTSGASVLPEALVLDGVVVCPVDLKESRDILLEKIKKYKHRQNTPNRWIDTCLYENLIGSTNFWFRLLQ